MRIHTPPGHLITFATRFRRGLKICSRDAKTVKATFQSSWRLAPQVKGEGESPDASAERTRGLGPESEAPDLRSPLVRFRTKPKKPLSVTDLVSPSWCELQYWYTLTLQFGRKKKTPAMRQGSKVHKTLENQVHREVRVDIKTKEDAWGLRIFNIIQGLRTLRNRGMTRELEVWGIIDGQIVNGVIDELSYICPDRELEEASGPTVIDKNLPAEANGGVLKSLRSLVKKTSRVYITDVKTRGVRKIPQGASFRPTLMQLMLYHRLLSDLADSRTDPAIFFDRYNLQPNVPFSDAFLAQVAAIIEVDDTFDDVPSKPPSPSDEVPSSSSAEPESSSTTISQDNVQLILSHNSLQQLWTLMMDEFALTMSQGAASIGTVLKVEYRDQMDGTIIGMKTFLHDNDVLQSYLEDGMKWWKGEREARGVCVEEAYKCGSCDFAQDCDWRKNKIEEATEVYRRTRSVV